MPCERVEAARAWRVPPPPFFNDVPTMSLQAQFQFLGRLAEGAAHCRHVAERVEQAKATAAILGDDLFKRYPWVHYDCGGESRRVLPMTGDPVDALLARTWRPTLSVTGAEGFPAPQDAGNVLRPYTAFKLSLRLPPLVDAAQAVQQVEWAVGHGCVLRCCSMRATARATSGSP